MGSKTLLLLLSVVATGLCSNKTRYKVVLKQKGYAQFLQYDVVSPPLKELTLCMWIKLYDNQGPQSILTYLGKGNNRIVKIWLDDKARNVMLTIKGYIMPKLPINLGTNIWHNFCFSYQSDSGAYALYLNGDLLQCEATEKLIGYSLPSGGSLIIGYGITLEGKPIGLSGEIYGVNMIIASTILSNNSANNRFLDLKPIDKQMVTSHSSNIRYVILEELEDTEANNNDQHHLILPQGFKSNVQFNNHRYFKESLSSKVSKLPKDIDFNKTKSQIGRVILDKVKNYNHNIHAKHHSKVELNLENHFGSTDISETSFKQSPSLSEFEVPPPLPSIPRTTQKPAGFHKHDKQSSQQINHNLKTNSLSEHIYSPVPPTNIQAPSLDNSKIFYFPVTNSEIKIDSLAQHVVPPPPPLNDFPLKEQESVHKQRTNKKKTEKKTMKKKSTKQNHSIGDISEFELPPPPTTDYKVYGQWTAFTHNGKIPDFLKLMRFDHKRVPPTIPLITVSETFPYPPYKMATNLVPNNVHRRVFYKRDTLNPEINVKILEDDIRQTILNNHAKTEVHNVAITHRGQSKDYRPYRDILSNTFDNYDDDNKERPLFVELPFIKALEYYQPDLRHIVLKNYSINTDTHSAHTIKQDVTLSSGQEISKHYDHIDTVNIPKQNSKYVFKEKLTDALASQIDVNSKQQKREKGFDRNVKLGNALNERFIIGKNAEQKKRSFEGGDDLVPDINRYRSDIDTVFDKVPNSLMPQVCKSIDMLDLSVKNIEKHTLSTGTEFILKNLQRESISSSKLELDPLIYINWHRTPVRLFGGALPVKEKNICTFIKCAGSIES